MFLKNPKQDLSPAAARGWKREITKVSKGKLAPPNLKWLCVKAKTYSTVYEAKCWIPTGSDETEIRKTEQILVDKLVKTYKLK